MDIDIRQIRATFPALADRTFLDAACVSLISQPVHDEIRRFLDVCLVPQAADTSLHHIAMDVQREGAVREAARLLNADPDSVALVESTTHGLSLAAAILPLERGDRVLIADTEFLQVAMPWQMKAERDGIEIVPVRSHDEGVLTADDFARVMDARTRVVCVSSVQWSSGYRVDLRALGDLCRARGASLVVDAIQQLGACRLDVQATPVDILVAGGHKWLNAPFGCGLLYVSRSLVQSRNAPAWGYLALEEPEGGWGEYFRSPTATPFEPRRFVTTAKKYETGGTSNYPGAVGLGASLRQINGIGIDAIEAHIRRLTDRLHDALPCAGARVVSKRGPNSVRSGITTFTCYDDPARDRALVDRLLAARVFVSMRYASGVGGIRVSTHFFNDEGDVERLVEAVGRG